MEDTFTQSPNGLHDRNHHPEHHPSTRGHREKRIAHRYDRKSGQNDGIKDQIQNNIQRRGSGARKRNRVPDGFFERGLLPVGHRAQDRLRQAHRGLYRHGRLVRNSQVHQLQRRFEIFVHLAWEVLLTDRSRQRSQIFRQIEHRYRRSRRSRCY